jgi:hypothetical protein
MLSSSTKSKGLERIMNLSKSEQFEFDRKDPVRPKARPSMEQQPTEAKLGLLTSKTREGDLTGPDSRWISDTLQPGGRQLQLMAPVGEEVGKFASGFVWSLESGAVIELEGEEVSQR